MKTLRKTIIFLALIVSVMTMYSFVTHASNPVFTYQSRGNMLQKGKKSKTKMTVKYFPNECKGKQWKFASSDKGVVTVKKAGKTSCIVTKNKKCNNGIAVIQAKCKGFTCYEVIIVGAGDSKARKTSKTIAWEKRINHDLTTGETQNTSNTNTTVTTTTTTSTSSTETRVRSTKEEKEISLKNGTRDSNGILWQCTWWGYDRNGKVVYDAGPWYEAYYKNNRPSPNVTSVTIGDTTYYYN